MPDMLRNNLQERLLACFDVDPLQDRDSASLSSEEATFEALHFSWYNQHCTNARSLRIFSWKSMSIHFLQRNGAPDNVQPAMLKRAGCSRTNHHQFIPYMSKDITDHAQVYQLVKKILRDVFDWLAEKVSTLMSQVRG